MRRSSLLLESLSQLPSIVIGVGFASLLGAAFDRFDILPWWSLPMLVVTFSPLVFWRPFELLLVVLDPRMRRARPGEIIRVSRAVEAISNKAGLPRRRWVYAVERSSQLNASTSGRHVLAVTPVALALPERHLEAVLAHELGHQIEHDTLSGALSWWFLMPAGVIGGVSRRAARFVLLFSSVVAVPLVLLSGILQLMIALPVMAMLPVHSLLQRRNELAADRFAADIGYSCELVEIFDALGVPSRKPLIRRLISSHPDPERRARALREVGRS